MKKLFVSKKKQKTRDTITGVIALCILAALEWFTGFLAGKGY